MAEVTLEEMEQQFAAEEVKAAPKAADLKLEAEDLPDYAKGTTAAELVDKVDKLQRALQLSEDARLALRNQPVVTKTEEVKPTGPKAMTREELTELAKEDPMAVFDYMSAHMSANLDNHLNTRFRPFVEGTIAQAETDAKARYKDEFALFGDQIAQVKTKVNAQVLGSSAGWDDIISYIRGQPGNFDKLVEQRTTTKARNKETARQEQVLDTGFTPRASARQSPIVVDTQGLDETQLEICKIMNIDPKDYKKYS